MRALYRITHWLRNCIGAFKCYSGCMRCGDYWNWKPKAYFPYDDDGVYIKGEKAFVQTHQQMFAICAECADTIEDDEKYQYCIWLVEKWIRGGPWEDDLIALRKRIIAQRVGE